MLIVQCHKGTSLFGRLIRWQTRGDYSHISLMWMDHATRAPMEGVEAREGKGVRLFGAQTYAAEVRRGAVEQYAIPSATLVQQLEAYLFAAAQVGAGYDYLGVLKFVSRRKAREDQRWFCSELAYAALERAGVPLLRGVRAAEVNPGMLARSPLLERFAPLVPEMAVVA